MLLGAVDIENPAQAPADFTGRGDKGAAVAAEQEIRGLVTEPIPLQKRRVGDLQPERALGMGGVTPAMLDTETTGARPHRQLGDRNGRHKTIFQSTAMTAAGDDLAVALFGSHLAGRYMLRR